MSIPNLPGTADLSKAINIVGGHVKTSKLKQANWNLKLPKSSTKLPDSAFRKLSRAAQFFREGHYTLEDIKKIKDDGKKVADAAKLTKDTADAAKKTSDIVTKVQETLLKKVPGSNLIDKASRIGGILGILATIGFVVMLKFQEFVTGRAFDDLSRTNLDLTKVNTTAVNNAIKLKALDTKIHKLEKELDTNAKDYYQLNKQQESFGKTITETKKQANDALYETREGRKILDGKVAEVKKQTNNALYETREGRKILDGKVAEVKKQANNALYETREGRRILDGKVAEVKKQANDALSETRTNNRSLKTEVTGLRTSFDAKIQSINTQISKFNSGVSDTFQKAVNTTISKVKADLARTQAEVKAIKPTPATDTAGITAKAVAAARALVTPLQSQVVQLNGQIIGLQGQTVQIPVLANALGNLAKNLNTVDAKADAAMNEARDKGVPNLAPIQKQLDDKFNQFVTDNNKALGIVGFKQSDLAKEFDKKLADFNRLNNLTSDQRFNEFKKQNDKDLGIIGFKQSDLAKEFDKKLADFKRQDELTSDQRFEEFQRTNKQSLGLIEKDLTSVKNDIKFDKSQIEKIDTKLREQAKVNDQALPKLDQIVGILGLIPARAAAAIRPDIPTIPQIETAAATGTCRTTQPGGCMNKALGDNANQINNNTNNRAGDILGAVNAGANTAELTLLNTINAKLGAQLPGGIAGKLSRFAEWAHLDRVLNIITTAATIHNAAMLSNNLGQTLFSLINNVLNIIGLKDAEGQAFDIGTVISKGIEGLIIGAVGAENYKSLNATWKRANRIYQATANILNALQSISASILNALEVVGQWNAKVGNALKRFGVVGEKAYEWMNPNVNFQNKYFTALENATNVISQIDQVASEVLSVKETVGQIVEQKKEIDDSLKETDDSKQKTDLPEAAKLAQKEKESKQVSAALALAENDKQSDGE